MTASAQTKESNFSVKITSKGKGQWPALKGLILEGDSQIGTFSRKALQGGYIPDIECKFSSERARNRLADQADCLTMGEIIEAMMC